MQRELLGWVTGLATQQEVVVTEDSPQEGVNASLSTGHDGMLIGPYHSRYAEDQQLRRDELAAQEAEAAASDG